MNNRQNAINQIIDFLKSDEKSLLITGTHQYEKHKLVLQVLSNVVNNNSSILFRMNSLKNAGTIFENHTANFKTGNGYKLGKHTLFVDSITKTSWKNTKYDYDFAILYPLDSTLKMKNSKEVFDDLFRMRSINKIFLVSWTDNLDYDYNNINLFYDRHIVLDALEEDPEYHKRMIELIDGRMFY